MRNEAVIRHQLKQVLYRHLQRKLKDNFKRSPENCHYNLNVVANLDPAVMSRSASVPAICLLKSTREGAVFCDRKCGGMEQARTCEEFTPLQTAESLKEEFKQFILTASERSDIARQYPDAAALMWVLDSSELEASDLEVEDPEEFYEEEMVSPDIGFTPKEGFWKRLFQFLRG